MKKITVALLVLALVFCNLTAGPAYAASREEVDSDISSIPADWPKAPDIDAASAVLMDADSGEILYALNATEACYPASTTKLMTALLTLENCSLSDIVDFPYEAVNIPAGSSHIGMRRGEQMVLKECLYGLLLPSANEVANALALHISGDLDRFAILMNERAELLHTVNTHFVNCNGLQDEDHYTCAYDLALIMQACIKNSTFVEIASTPSYVHHADELLDKDIPMTNTDMMIRSSSEYYNEYVVCGKTGHTDEAGYNLVTYAEKDGMRLIVTVMGCEDGNQYKATQSLLDYGFNYFERVLPAELDSSLSMENAFTGSPLGIPTPDVSLLKVDATDSILLPDSVTFDMLEKSAEQEEDGTISIRYSYEGYPLGAVSLSSGDDEDSGAIYKKTEKTELDDTDVPDLFVIDGWIVIAILGAVILAAAIVIILSRWNQPVKKRKHRKKR